MGNRLEKLVRKVAKNLRDQQKAKLWKMPNDLRITSSGLLTFGDQTPVDFVGHNNQGRAVLIECKDYISPSLALGKGGLKPHQWMAMQECHDVGGIAILLWSHYELIAAMDMDMIRSLVRGRKSISWKAIPDGWVRPFGEVGVMALFDKHRVGGS